MPQVTYVQPDGSATTCGLTPGQSLMDGALDNHVPGIIGQCGGAATCATCHCYVREPYFSRLPPPHPDEAEMLEYVNARQPNSRLSCQIRPDESLDGVVVDVPASQH